MSGNVKVRILIALLVLSEIFYLLLFPAIGYPIIRYTSVAVVNSLLFILMVFLIRGTAATSKLAYTLIAVGILFRITVLFFPPTASDDINRYIWDGKVQSAGINPYRYAPNDSALAGLHSQLLPGSVNFPEMKSIYPPYAQLIFFTSYNLFGESYTGFKIFLLVFEILTMILLLMLLRRLKLPETYCGIYALCPLPIMQFLIDGHVDGLGIPILVLTLLLFFQRKKIPFYVALGLSISTKLISGMILPFTANELEKKNLRKILAGMIPLVVFAVTYVPFFTKGVFPFESLMTFTANWTFNGSAFTAFYNIIGDNQKARLLSALLFLAYGSYLFFSRKEITVKIYSIFLAFFLLSPTVHPWYLAWLAVLLPMNFRWSGLAFIASASLANYVVIDYKLKGIWQMPGFIMLIEYLPVYILLIWENIRDSRFLSLKRAHDSH